MKASQLDHLPKILSLSEESYLVHEQASITGEVNVKPITLGIIGLYHEKADPRGLPNVEVHTPMPSVDHLVYADSKHAIGESIPVSGIKYGPLSTVNTYESDTTKANTSNGN